MKRTWLKTMHEWEDGKVSSWMEIDEADLKSLGNAPFWRLRTKRTQLGSTAHRQLLLQSSQRLRMEPGENDP